jgi:drug/metabolite transporter (DMT)-like permease
MQCNTQTKLLSIAPLSIYVLSWIAMGELIQGLLTDWPATWFLTYCIKSGFVTSLLPYFVLRRVRLSRAAPLPLPVHERTLVVTAACLSPISTLCTITWYLSLSGTSVAGNSAVYQVATPFALLLSAVFLREAVTLRKLACVGLALVGVAMVSLGGSAAGGRDTVQGYAWVVLSCFLYALYEVLYAMRAKPAAAGAPGLHQGAEEEEALLAADPTTAAAVAADDAAAASAHLPPSGATAEQALLKAETAALVLGTIGVATLLTQWPFFFIASAAGWEKFSFPPPADKGRLVALNVVLDSIYNLSLLWGISSSSAFAMQLASTLVVPVGILADWLLHGQLPTVLRGLGSLLIIAAVVGLDAPLPKVLCCAGRPSGEGV